jgi:hypothetical protein
MLDDRSERIARYKTVLREYIERRPSGLRGRLALALGKHKSFISQITNPTYGVPIPVGDLATIFDVCHLSQPERRRFLELYGSAHPERAPRLPTEPYGAHELRIALPRFRSETVSREVEAMILDFAARTIRLAQRVEAGETTEGGRPS